MSSSPGMKPSKAKKNRKRKKKDASPSLGNATADGGDPPEGRKEEGSCEGGCLEEEEERTLSWLIDAFSSCSLEQVQAAYHEAQGDPFKAAVILGASSATSTGSESSSGAPAVGNKGGRNRKQKKVVASTGLVSDVIGKGYVASVEGGRRSGSAGRKEPWKERYTHEEAEEFLCSMLGGSCELDPAVVKDVFGQCGYDVEKTLDTLLDMSAPPSN